MVETRSSSSQATGNSDGGAFAQHAKEDTALADPTINSNEDESNKSSGLSIFGRIFIFIIFPLTSGVIGLYLAHLESLRKPERTISFDTDFVMPFLLALALSIVIGFQTGGFSSNKVKPLISWPKVRRVKKIIRKKKGEAAEDREDFSSKKNN